MEKEILTIALECSRSLCPILSRRVLSPMLLMSIPSMTFIIATGKTIIDIYPVLNPCERASSFQSIFLRSNNVEMK